MWLSERIKGRAEPNAAEAGTVTIAGKSPAVMTDTERRGLRLCGPGGYYWAPERGQDMLVIKCGPTEAAAGLDDGVGPSDLAPGEVCLMSKNGAAYLRLNNDGSIVLTGDLYIVGSAYLNGAAVDAGGE